MKRLQKKRVKISKIDLFVPLLLGAVPKVGEQQNLIYVYVCIHFFHNKSHPKL